MMKWRNKIEIKKHLVESVTAESVLPFCDAVVSEVGRVLKFEERCSVVGVEIICELEEIIDHFEFLRDLANGTIPEGDWNLYGFDGDFEEWANGHLSELYDLGDLKIDIGSQKQKFIWVG